MSKEDINKLLEIKKQAEEEEEGTYNNSQIPTSNQKETDIHWGTKQIVSTVLFVIGGIFLIFAFKFLCSDLDTYDGSQFKFQEEQYVGGDAYNYIISAARSTTIMVKSLIDAVIGCSSIILGQLVNMKK